MTVIHRKNPSANPLKASEPGVNQGKYSSTHKPWHDYMIVEQHAYPIFTEDWGADEELLLIEGAETLGLGNWHDIADHIGARSKEDVDKHYTQVYLESECYPLPNLKRAVALMSIPATEFAQRKKARLEARRNLTPQLPIPKQKPVASVPACHDVQGFMPGRLEFETEYENEAEISVKDMVFDPEDADVEVELKLAVLDIYNSRLTTRAEKKRLLIDHNLLDYRKNAALDKKRTKEERELFNRIKVLCRIMTPQDFEEFSMGILTELQCRRRIAELQEYRRNGIQTIDAASKYERDKANRIQALSRYGTPVASQAFVNNLNNPSAYASSALNSTSSSNDTYTTRSTSNSQAAASSYGPNSSMSGSYYHGSKALDISHATDVDLLSPEEQQLCSNLRIWPKPYLAIKETLFRELLRTGGILKKATARELIKIDVNKTSKIYEFFQSQRWLA
ncbi:transcriptional adaptor 2 [Nadsonia fulvescens var. elongata DSM 6958]|uniref:Transcriptional adapter 2 n=1 Tax=Nadsonia fulvescens var. elongata DSM 6958 TaxID=857566 RepID=A0A1E3PDK8_9ASCO|nr:transcriptional adaptor 2 [Nadsonia fulvescens var. elongata DSM 6958]